MGLIIVILALLFWWMKSVAEKGAVYDDDRYGLVHRRDPSWLESVTNKELEDEFRSRLKYRDYSQSGDKATDLIKEVKDSWRTYYKTDFNNRTFSNINHSRMNNGNNMLVSDEDCIRILMANRGFLIVHEACNGIYCVGYDKPILDVEKQRRDDIDFIKKIDEVLKKRGLGRRIYFVPSIRNKNDRVTKYDIDHAPLGNGRFVWEPAAPAWYGW